MIKEKGKSKNVFFGFFIFIALAIGITAVVYKLYNKIDVKSDFSKVTVKKKDKDKISIYDMYEVTSEKAYDGGYYVTFTDVISDAASKDNQKHYFNIAFTAHVTSKVKSEQLQKAKEVIVLKLRQTLGNLRTTDIGNPEVFEYVRNNIRLEMNKVLGKDNIKGIYFESFLSQ